MARTAVSGRTRGGTSLVPGTTTGRVNIPSTTSIDLTATFSISLWAKQTAHGYLLYKDGETASGYSISTQGVYFAVTNVVLVNINNSIKNSNTEAISLGVWNHIVVTYDATNVRIYINGVLNRTIASSAPSTDASDLVIGNKAASNALNGKIDDVRIYKGRVLSLTEVQSLYLGKSPLNTSLSGWWKFDETSGTVAIDSSANGNNGTITNSTRSTDIPLPHTKEYRKPYIKSYGTSLLFDGVNDLVDVGSGSTIRSSVVTMFARVKMAAGSAYRVILGYATAGFSFRINSSDQVELLKAGVISIGTSTGVLDKKYHSVAVTYDASGNYVFYIDGEYSGSGTNLQAITFTGNCQLGVSAGGEWFKGNIDDVQYYNAVLTPAEILDLHYGKESTASSLKGWWKFDEGSGSSATDSSGNGNTGTITQATYSNNVMFKPRTAVSGRDAVNPGEITPDEISGLQLWLKADALSLSDSDPVTSWTDSSGNAKHATQSTAGNKPLYKANQINTLPAIQFDDTNDWLSTPSITLSDMTVFIVAKGTAQGYIASFANGFNDNGLIYGFTGSLIEIYTSPRVSAGDGSAFNYFTMVRKNGTGTTMYRQGTQVATDPSTLTSNTGTISLGRHDVPGDYWGGLLAEVIIYDSALSTEDRESIELYLANKYAL